MISARECSRSQAVVVPATPDSSIASLQHAVAARELEAALAAHVGGDLDHERARAVVALLGRREARRGERADQRAGDDQPHAP